MLGCKSPQLRPTARCMALHRRLQVSSGVRTRQTTGSQSTLAGSLLIIIGISPTLAMQLSGAFAARVLLVGIKWEPVLLSLFTILTNHNQAHRQPATLLLRSNPSSNILLQLNNLLPLVAVTVIMNHDGRVPDQPEASSPKQFITRR